MKGYVIRGGSEGTQGAHIQWIEASRTSRTRRVAVDSDGARERVSAFSVVCDVVGNATDHHF